MVKSVEYRLYASAEKIWESSKSFKQGRFVGYSRFCSSYHPVWSLNTKPVEKLAGTVRCLAKSVNSLFLAFQKADSSTYRKHVAAAKWNANESLGNITFLLLSKSLSFYLIGKSQYMKDCISRGKV